MGNNAQFETKKKKMHCTFFALFEAKAIMSSFLGIVIFGVLFSDENVEVLNFGRTTSGMVQPLLYFAVRKPVKPPRCYEAIKRSATMIKTEND